MPTYCYLTARRIPIGEVCPEHGTECLIEGRLRYVPLERPCTFPACPCEGVCASWRAELRRRGGILARVERWLHRAS